MRVSGRPKDILFSIYFKCVSWFLELSPSRLTADAQTASGVHTPGRHTERGRTVLLGHEATQGLGSTLDPSGGRGIGGKEHTVWPNTASNPGENVSIFSATCYCHTPICTADGYLSLVCCLSASCVFLTWRTGLLCMLGKAVGLFSHRIRSLWDRHIVLDCPLPPSPSPMLTSSCLSSSRLNRRWWWSRYAAFRDRKRANHLWRAEQGEDTYNHNENYRENIFERSHR